ncbi:MAG: hypothetical protein EAZ11_01500 [Curvibacter sp.]|nr:MAG: hypothetical protein EAZ11_01500 [Curvibacter sp.]
MQQTKAHAPSGLRRGAYDSGLLIGPMTLHKIWKNVKFIAFTLSFPFKGRMLQVPKMAVRPDNCRACARLPTSIAHL